MGYFILPGRLDKELSILAEHMTLGTLQDITEDSPAFKHVEWANEILASNTLTKENVYDVLRHEIGNVCTHVLEDSGVFKMNKHGIDGFVNFLTSVLQYNAV